MISRVAIAQVKPQKGNYTANVERVGEIIAQLEEEQYDTDILILPETALTGYFLEGGVRDVSKSAPQVFADLQETYRRRTRRKASALDICVGFYEYADGRYHNSALYATLTSDDTAPVESRMLHVHRKFFLPTYGVFDEARFVARGRSIGVIQSRFGPVAILICEDAWHSLTATIAALKGAQIIIVPSASPGRDFAASEVGSVARWNALLPGIAQEHNVWVVYAGLVGFEGGKGFSGTSQIIDPWGHRRASGPYTEECIVRGEIDLEDVAVARSGSPLLADLEAAISDLAIELETVVRLQA